MSHNPTNYPQNYQNYYQSMANQYDEYGEDENQENYEEVVPALQVPNSRLYAEGNPDVTELYVGDAQFVESQQHLENASVACGHEYNPTPNNYYYMSPPHHYHRNRVPKAQSQPQSTSNYRYSHPNSVYNSCPLTANQSLPGATQNLEDTSYVPKVGINAYSSTGRPISQNIGLNDPDDTNYMVHNVQGQAYLGSSMERTIPQNVGVSNLNSADSHYDPKVMANTYSGLTRAIPQKTALSNYHQGVGEDYDIQLYDEYQKRYAHFDQAKGKVYASQENYEDCCTGTKLGYGTDNGLNQEIYVDHKGKRYRYYGNRLMGKSGNMKKYPVTVKTPKYVTKSPAVQPLHKKPSALCLPVVTQADPGLVKRKSRTHHKIYNKSEQISQNPNDATEQYLYPAHEMHSEGDMNQKSTVPGLDNLLDQFEGKVGLNENQETGDGKDGEAQERIKEFSKFLKPRIPSSVKAKQERIAKMKASLNMSGIPLQPKMKLSLDKLLNRLQKCEITESAEQLSGKSSKTRKTEEEEEEEKEESNKRKNIQHKSFNYENLTRKLSPTMKPDDHEISKRVLNKTSTSLTTSLDTKKSSRLIRPLDDHCAIDLHRSKSYIVDLIDRALSKELGTVPREPSSKNEMTPKHAIKTISRHRQCSHKELCYEVTAALTDSFISNISAPQKQDDQMLKRSASDEVDATKLCTSFSDDGNYIKQLKQLRWGHIRHIQHEARKLAELEEFLEKCGEIEY